jgi:hypothetical protein
VVLLLAGLWIGALALVQVTSAQDRPAERGPEGLASEMPETVAATDTPPEATRTRVAVVLSGDANEEARLVAETVERAVAGTLALPSDAGLRASLLGATGEDTIAPVVRDRRALGGSEAEDVPLLASLGDRADARLLLVTRRRGGARELVVFDVANRAFFEGALTLDAHADEARILRFVRARVRAAEGALEAPASGPTALEAAAEARVGRAITAGSTRGSGGAHEPDWLELNWPYLLAGALLAGAAAFVIVYTVEDRGPTPTLRFQPGGMP